jgi:hypothetical protein
MADQVEWYPGEGADEEIARLQQLVGKITAYWAELEDSLFTVFVFALAGTLNVGSIEPYRAVFFTFPSYDAKMRMLHKAMKARFPKGSDIMNEWLELRKSLNAFADLRNEIAHLIARPKYFRDPKVKAIVRLAPPFWKPDNHELIEFEQRGYSWDELTKALAPFWGFDPSLNIPPTGEPRLASRLDKFHERLQPFRKRSPREPRPDQIS